jgi:predicted dehydrogenase
MERRDFIKAGATAAAVAATKPLFGWQGANNRVRMAVIGCGNRAGRVFDSLARHSDVQWVGACEVNQQRLAGFMNASRQTYKLENVVDYRKILDRKDVDAVLIGTPDFSHARIMIDAVSAGKDVYVEKPASNSIPRINGMLDAFNKGKQIVQVGTQQRSWDYFQDAKKIVDSGQLGTISHVTITQPGTYARPKEAEAPVPAGLDWKMWQLLGMPLGAPERGFKPSRLGFRAWYEYGSGLIGDWGAHHVDVALWFMNADHKQPIKTMANGAFFAVPDADPEMVPDTFAISWLYDNFLLSFANAEVYMDPAKENPIENWGVYFIGTRGSLQVNRQGYVVRGVVPHVIRKQGAPPPPTAGGVTLGAGGTQIAPGAPGQGGAPGAGGPGGGRGGRQGGGRAGGAAAAPTVPLEPKVVVNPKGGVEEDYPLDVHTRNFLDSVKSRQKPAATMEIGYNSALPCLIALEALKTNKILGWDAAKRETKVL